MGEKNTINTNKTIVLELNYCCNLNVFIAMYQMSTKKIALFCR